MNLRARSSRVTGPKMRVPIGSPCFVMRTAALRSKRMALPSGRRISFAVRTITAWCTSPFLTRPRGIASLTETTMTSPTVAVLRLEPPSTLMHWTRRAPELSATSRLVCIWIMTRSPLGLGAGRGLFLRPRRARLGRRPGDLGLRLARRRRRLARRRWRGAVEQRHPALAPRDRAALLDADHVARLDEVVLVMRGVVLRAHDELLVDGMHDAPLDAHDHRLVPRVSDGHTLKDTLRHRSSLSLGAHALGQNGLDPRHVAPHLARPRRVLQLSARLLEAQVEALLGELLQRRLELVVGLGAHVARLHGWASPARDTMRVSIGSFAAASRNASRAVGLEHDAARLDAAHPELGRALAAAHAYLGRLHRDRHVREDADPHAADTLDVAGDGAARRLDLARGDAARRCGLQPEIAEIERGAALGLAMDAALMRLAVFGALR